MSEPNWAQVLDVLYAESGYVDYPEHSDHGIPEDNILLQKTGLSKAEVKDGIDHLRRANLVRDKRSDEGKVVGLFLEEKAYNVGHERELAKRHDRTNRVLAGLTAVLAFTASVQTLAAFLTMSGQNRLVMMLGAGIIGLAIIGSVWSFDLV